MALMKIKNYTDNRSITTDKKVIPYSSAKMMMTTTSNGNYKSLTMRILINADNNVLKLKMSIILRDMSWSNKAMLVMVVVIVLCCCCNASNSAVRENEIVSLPLSSTGENNNFNDD